MNAYDALRYLLTQISVRPQTSTVAQMVGNDPIARVLQPGGVMGGRDF